MKCYEKTIAELRDMFEHKQIELDPPYQRKPAWKSTQRRLLLSSLFNGIPIHSFFISISVMPMQKMYTMF